MSRDFYVDDEGCYALQDMATKVFMSAKDIYQNHASWAATGVNVSDTPSGQFLLMSGETFFTGHRKVGLPQSHVHKNTAATPWRPDAPSTGP